MACSVRCSVLYALMGVSAWLVWRGHGASELQWFGRPAIAAGA